MRNSLRFIRILTLLGLFTGLASAQGAPFTCVSNSTITPALRGEGYTERTGDIAISCTGGTAIAPGSSIPLVNITIFYNTTVTNRLLSLEGNVNSTDALLLIDEPGSGLGTFGSSLPQVLCATPLTGCPAFVGAVPGPTFGQAVSSGTTPAPNVYQGVMTGTSVTFFGVPVLPPAGTGQRVFRITNVLVDATALAGNPAQFNPVQASISISGSTSFPILNPTPSVGFVLSGLTATTSPATQLPQCSSQTRTSVNLLQFSENFGTSFKTRVAAQTNTVYAGQIKNSIQNIPGAIYNSESGFVFPIGNQVAGLADFGTRLKATFNNIPAGVRIYVSTSNVLNEVTPVPIPAVVGGSVGNLNSPNPYVGYAQLINGEATSDDNQFPAVPPTNTGPGTSGTVPVIELPVDMNGHATAVWEVVNTNPNTIETFKFAVYATYAANPAQNTPTPGTATVNLSYAPNANSGVAADSSVPLPRFIPDPNPANAIFSMNSCGSASITVDTAPSGRAITVDGTSYTAPQTFNWLVGTNHTLSTSTPQAGTPGTRYVFASWSQGGAIAQTVMVPSSSTSYIANFNTEYLLTTSVTPAAGGAITPGGWISANNLIFGILATANAGYQFAGFSGDLTSTDNPHSLLMDGPKNVVANFAALTPLLNGSISSRAGEAAVRQWILTLTNSGLGAATGARITGVALTQAGGVACSSSPAIVNPVPPPSPANPLLVGNVGTSSSGSARVTLNFGGCAPSARFKVVISFAADGGYSGSTTLNNQFY